MTLPSLTRPAKPALLTGGNPQIAKGGSAKTWRTDYCEKMSPRSIQLHAQAAVEGERRAGAEAARVGRAGRFQDRNIDEVGENGAAGRIAGMRLLPRVCG